MGFQNFMQLFMLTLVEVFDIVQGYFKLSEPKQSSNKQQSQEQVVYLKGALQKYQSSRAQNTKEILKSQHGYKQSIQTQQNKSQQNSAQKDRSKTKYEQIVKDLQIEQARQKYGEIQEIFSIGSKMVFKVNSENNNNLGTQNQASSAYEYPKDSQGIRDLFYDGDKNQMFDSSIVQDDLFQHTQSQQDNSIPESPDYESQDYFTNRKEALYQTENIQSVDSSIENKQDLQLDKIQEPKVFSQQQEKQSKQEKDKPQVQDIDNSNNTNKKQITPYIQIENAKQGDQTSPNFTQKWLASPVTNSKAAYSKQRHNLVRQKNQNQRKQYCNKYIRNKSKIPIKGGLKFNIRISSMQSLVGKNGSPGNKSRPVKTFKPKSPQRQYGKLLAFPLSHKKRSVEQTQVQQNQGDQQRVVKLQQQGSGVQLFLPLPSPILNSSYEPTKIQQQDERLVSFNNKQDTTQISRLDNTKVDKVLVQDVGQPDDQANEIIEGQKQKHIDYGKIEVLPNIAGQTEFDLLNSITQYRNLKEILSQTILGPSLTMSTSQRPEVTQLVPVTSNKTSNEREISLSSPRDKTTNQIDTEKHIFIKKEEISKAAPVLSPRFIPQNSKYQNSSQNFNQDNVKPNFKSKVKLSPKDRQLESLDKQLLRRKSESNAIVAIQNQYDIGIAYIFSNSSTVRSLSDVAQKIDFTSSLSDVLQNKQSHNNLKIKVLQNQAISKVWAQGKQQDSQKGVLLNEQNNKPQKKASEGLTYLRRPKLIETKQQGTQNVPYTNIPKQIGKADKATLVIEKVNDIQNNLSKNGEQLKKEQIVDILESNGIKLIDQTLPQMPGKIYENGLFEPKDIKSYPLTPNTVRKVEQKLNKDDKQNFYEVQKEKLIKDVPAQKFNNKPQVDDLKSFPLSPNALTETEKEINGKLLDKNTQHTTSEQKQTKQMQASIGNKPTGQKGNQEQVRKFNGVQSGELTESSQSQASNLVNKEPVKVQIQHDTNKVDSLQVPKTQNAGKLQVDGNKTQELIVQSLDKQQEKNKFKKSLPNETNESQGQAIMSQEAAKEATKEVIEEPGTKQHSQKNSTMSNVLGRDDLNSIDVVNLPLSDTQVQTNSLSKAIQNGLQRSEKSINQSKESMLQGQDDVFDKFVHGHQAQDNLAQNLQLSLDQGDASAFKSRKSIRKPKKSQKAKQYNKESSNVNVENKENQQPDFYANDLLANQFNVFNGLEIANDKDQQSKIKQQKTLAAAQGIARGLKQIQPTRTNDTKSKVHSSKINNKESTIGNQGQAQKKELLINNEKGNVSKKQVPDKANKGQKLPKGKIERKSQILNVDINHLQSKPEKDQKDSELTKMKVVDLKQMASALGITQISQFKKAELIDQILAAQNNDPSSNPVKQNTTTPAKMKKESQSVKSACQKSTPQKAPRPTKIKGSDQNVDANTKDRSKQLQKLKVVELQEMASKLGIKYYKALKKGDLIHKIEHAELHQDQQI